MLFHHDGDSPVEVVPRDCCAISRLVRARAAVPAFDRNDGAGHDRGHIHLRSRIVTCADDLDIGQARAGVGPHAHVPGCPSSQSTNLVAFSVLQLWQFLIVMMPMFESTLLTEHVPPTPVVLAAAILGVVTDRRRAHLDERERGLVLVRPARLHDHHRVPHHCRGQGALSYLSASMDTILGCLVAVPLLELEVLDDEALDFLLEVVLPRMCGGSSMPENASSYSSCTLLLLVLLFVFGTKCGISTSATAMCATSFVLFTIH